MSRSSRIHSALTSTTVKPNITAYVIRGVSNESIVEDLKQRIKLPLLKRMPSMESEQEDNKLKQDAVLSLFVFKPKQTGYASVAEMTATAINNPAHTAILSLHADDENLDERIDRETMVDILTGAGAQVFNDTATAAEYANELAGQDTEEAVEIVN